MQTTNLNNLTPTQLLDIIKVSGMRGTDEGDSVTLTFTNRRTGSKLVVELERAFQMQRVGAAGWWVKLTLPGERHATSVATFATAEPLRSWAWQNHKKLTLHQQRGDTVTRLKVANWLACYLTKPYGEHDLLRGCKVDAVVRTARRWNGLELRD